MASTLSNIVCSTCNIVATAATCSGCGQHFCNKDYIEHRKKLSQDVDKIEQDHDLLRERLVIQDCESQLLSRIDTWEQYSRRMIELVASQARTDVHCMVQKMKTTIRNSLTEVETEMQETRQNDAYSEFKILIWQNQLQKLRETLEKPFNIGLQDDDQKISLHMIKVVEIGKYLSSGWNGAWVDVEGHFYENRCQTISFKALRQEALR
jgi:hypothetical protein